MPLTPAGLPPAPAGWQWAPGNQVLPPQHYAAPGVPPPFVMMMGPAGPVYCSTAAGIDWGAPPAVQLPFGVGPPHMFAHFPPGYPPALAGGAQIDFAAPMAPNAYHSTEPAA